EWPDRLLGRVGPELTRRDAVCVLTHDAKFDVPALVSALETDAGYIGAMGSRRTHADRVVRLKEAPAATGSLSEDGVAARLERIRAQLGLDIGARTPEGSALSICVEIIADRTGRSSDVRPLRARSGPIHRPMPSGAGSPGRSSEAAPAS